MIVLDTNILSEMMRARPDPHVMSWLNRQRPNQIYVSAITQAEMLLGVALLPTGKRRTSLATQIDALFAEDFAHRCLPFDSQAASHYAQIVSDRHKSGKPVSTEDAQIAAIARSRSFQIATRNVADFADIHALGIVNPWVASD